MARNAESETPWKRTSLARDGSFAPAVALTGIELIEKPLDFLDDGLLSGHPFRSNQSRKGRVSSQPLYGHVGTKPPQGFNDFYHVFLSSQRDETTLPEKPFQGCPRKNIERMKLDAVDPPFGKPLGGTGKLVVFFPGDACNEMGTQGKPPAAQASFNGVFDLVQPVAPVEPLKARRISRLDSQLKPDFNISFCEFLKKREKFAGNLVWACSNGKAGYMAESR